MIPYEEALEKIQDLKARIYSNTGSRSDNTKELLRLKRNLSRYPEHKKKKVRNEED